VYLPVACHHDATRVKVIEKMGVAHYHTNGQNTYMTKPHTDFKILDIPLPHTNLVVTTYIFRMEKKYINRNLDGTPRNSLKLLHTVLCLINNLSVVHITAKLFR